LYVFQAITEAGKHLDKQTIYGGISAIFWVFILIITLKYIIYALSADNDGEGGIFALYALLKKKKLKWIIIPTLIGCAALMAEGFITPAISISSAVEGLSYVVPDINPKPYIVGIILALFFVQQFGTEKLGKTFGPVMLIWFGFAFFLGIINILKNPQVLEALNPIYALDLIVHSPRVLVILGGVTLCITGAETIYSDLGHCGKKNIRISWVFIMIALLVNYFGQAAICTLPNFQLQEGGTIFYQMVPKSMIGFSIAIATAASIIASQAVISGVFTLMNEAMKLRLWINFKVKYPSEHRGQIYIPVINWFLMIGSLGVVFIFDNSESMTAAYGLSININMVMTSVLLGFLLMYRHQKMKVFYFITFVVFLLIEIQLLIANTSKIHNGGWFTLLLSIIFFFFLFMYYQARMLRSSITEYVPLADFLPLMERVRNDNEIQYEATNLVYPARTCDINHLDSTIFYSLFRKKPRKAEVIWFVHLDITTKPWEINYTLKTIVPQHCYFVTFHLGFKEDHKMEYMIREIQQKLVEQGELANQSVFKSIGNTFEDVDFKFVIINTRIAATEHLTPFQLTVVKTYRFIKRLGLDSTANFGLEKTNIVQEFVPINLGNEVKMVLKERCNL
jgi:KUP system potassium uptake protein